MKKNLKILSIAILLTGTVSVKGQTPILNEEKYWIYRERLKNEFMIGIGPDFGYSITAAVRDTISGILKFTDCTTDLGHYLGILGMEYKILADAGEGTGETVRELYYAMYALNRLDYYAETYFGGDPSLNGFFVRDDVSEDLLDMDEVLAHLNQGLPQYKIDSLASDFMEDNPLLKEESLDQVIMLLTGLGLVVRCVPPEVEYIENNEVMQFQDFETSLHQEARHIIVRMVNYMKEGDSITVNLDPADTNLYGIMGQNWDFIIKNPVSYQNVFRGDNAFFLSTGYAGAKFWLTGQESPTIYDTNYQNALSAFLFLENFILPGNEDLKVLTLNAMSNIWPEGLQADTTFTDYNARVIGPRSLNKSWEWVPMVHQYLFKGNNYLMSQLPPDTAFYNDPDGYYSYLLDLAPVEGPYNYGDSLFPEYEWSSYTRTIHPESRGDTNPGFPGNYSGLDYMFYYNLHQINYNLPSFLHDEKPPAFRCYPNPSKGLINIEASGYNEISIYTIDGRALILNKKIKSNPFGLNISDYPDGIYIINLIKDYNTRSYHKIIKN